jgi:septum formation protein
VTLVLASTSRYRAQLLERLEISFGVAAPTADERALDPEFVGTTDEAFARLVARAKAHSLRDTVGDAWILAADQIAVLPVQPGIAARTLLHKPGSETAAVDQLLRLAGKTHRLVTGIALLHARTGRMLEADDVVELRMRSFDRAEASAYVAAHRPLDCVGSYRIEDAGIWLFDAVSGADPTSIMGLPLLRVCALLRAAGLHRSDESR